MPRHWLHQCAGQGVEEKFPPASPLWVLLLDLGHLARLGKSKPNWNHDTLYKVLLVYNLNNNSFQHNNLKRKAFLFSRRAVSLLFTWFPFRIFAIQSLLMGSGSLWLMGERALVSHVAPQWCWQFTAYGTPMDTTKNIQAKFCFPCFSHAQRTIRLLHR